MPYDAVSAYTVLVGEADGATTVTVHGTAEEAWAALAAEVRGRSTRWLPRHADAAAVADRWRAADPTCRFWQVTPHRLQVMVPTTRGGRAGAPEPRPRPAEPPAAPAARRHGAAWPSRARRAAAGRPAGASAVGAP